MNKRPELPFLNYKQLVPLPRPYFTIELVDKMAIEIDQSNTLYSTLLTHINIHIVF